MLQSPPAEPAPVWHPTAVGTTSITVAGPLTASGPMPVARPMAVDVSGTENYVHMSIFAN